MKSSENMVFVGLNGRVVALDRESGKLVWQWQSTKFGQQHMNLLPDGDRLIVSAGGYIYCLDPETGLERWHNPLTGFGVGVAALATIRSHSLQGDAAVAAAE
jgi:hypothetical protein